MNISRTGPVMYADLNVKRTVVKKAAAKKVPKTTKKKAKTMTA